MKEEKHLVKLRSLGKKNLVNNVLVLEIDNNGLLVEKNFYDKDEMNIKIVLKTTKVLDNLKKSFIRLFVKLKAKN